MKSLIIIGALCVLSVLPSVMGHAALVTPAAFNPQPQTTMKCGGPSSGTVTVVTAGAQTLQWKLIAGDGNGPNPVKINFISNVDLTNLPSVYTGTGSAPTGTGASSFTSTVVPSTIGTTYAIDYTMPAMTCTGSMGGRTDVCIAQVMSDTRWVACFAFAQSAATGTGGTGPTSTCQTATGLTACPMVNGKQVNVPNGETLQSLDVQVEAAITLNLNNTRVFLHGGVPSSVSHLEPTPCEKSYRAYLCGATFGACGKNGGAPPPVSPCAAVCAQFECWCQMNPIHQFLYDCESLNNAGRDLAGDCAQGYGPNNATCGSSSTGGNSNCDNGVLSDCSAGASVMASPAALAVAVLATVMARRYL